jgi:adenosylhomocysteine nucleosidase
MRSRDRTPNGNLAAVERRHDDLLPDWPGHGVVGWYGDAPRYRSEAGPYGLTETLARFGHSAARKLPALLVGFAAEARVARLSGWQVAIGGGTTEGAERETRRLIDAGATGIVSFGLAGGLDPALPAGTLIVAEAVTANGRVWRTDPELNSRLGGTTGHLCLGLDRVVSSAAEKQHLGRETGASLVDMESGAVAAIASEAGIPFAVLRAICDPADRALPPAALVALDPKGRLTAARLAMSVLANPRQLWALMGLAWDAASARRALRSRAVLFDPLEMLSEAVL